MSTPGSTDYEELVECWLPDDKGAIHVKVVVLPYNDPVELTASEARALAQRLLKLADEVES
jgi:hypothetical protein